MRTFYYAIGAKITRALEGEELVYEGPLYEVLRKWFSPDVHIIITEEREEIGSWRRRSLTVLE
jgi:hypothetical protein